MNFLKLRHRILGYVNKMKILLGLGEISPQLISSYQVVYPEMRIWNFWKAEY